MSKYFVSTVLSLFLCGCATQYSKDGMGFTGGAEAQMMTNDTARISARGNGFTDKATVTDFVMLKSAETALSQGFTHFAFIASEDASNVSSYTTPGYAQTNVYGNSAYTTYNPGMTDTVVKPGKDSTVRFCKQPPQNCSGMLPANEVVRNLGPRYIK